MAPKLKPPPRFGDNMKPSAWPVRPWQEVAKDALASGHAAHLSVVDEGGFPLPMRAHSLEIVAEGFTLLMPRGMPWKLEGRACLTFAGFRTFIGNAESKEGSILLRVERSLPQHPSTLDTKQVLKPSEDTLAKARTRLEYEAQRRGQPLPVIPIAPPERTRIALIRMARIASDSPITGITTEHGNRTT